MRRACKVSLSYVTAAKRREIARLLEAYRGAVNFYIRSLWDDPGNLDRATLARLVNTRLSERYKSQALKQALETVVATRKSGKVLGVATSRPIFRGSAVLDAKFVSIEEGRGSFDLMLRLSTLRKGKRITIPTRKTAVVNKWLDKPGAAMIHSCALSENQLVIWVKIPDEAERRDGDVLGVDVGVAKLLATSTGEFYGTDFRAIRDKVKRRRPGSKAKRRAIAERDQYINRICKSLPWDNLRAIGIENLKGLKSGKKKGRGKSFRKAVAPWSYRQVRQRIECLAQENRVRLVTVDPRYTSQMCPACDLVDRRNRRGEKFRCVQCGHSADADYVGSLNILARTVAVLGSLESPGPYQEVRR